MDPSILDNIEEIKQIDSSQMLSYLENIGEHYRKAEKNSNKILINYPKPSNIIIAGMGGSAIGGELLKDWAKNKVNVPIEIIRDYSLPTYANKDSLVLVLSYSGETEESLSAFLHALKKECMLYCISSGGDLIKYAKETNVPHFIVPSGMPPRAALPYMFTPLLIAFEKSGLISGISDELSEAANILEKISDENSPEIPANENYSKTLALGIGDTVPVVYAHGLFGSVARRFKQQFNENSKIPSRWEVFSELTHNEIVGWEQPGKFSKFYSAIFLRDKNESMQIRSRIELTKPFLSSPSNMFEVWSRGKTDLAKMLSIICIGDFTSVYHAILNRIDPTPVSTITQLKEKIKEFKTKEKILSELTKISNAN
ncbi:MAG: bifunctional phosphoglucose/phosphomannose isomerase [Candidatus Bathyarchaeota archaeon]|nr:bifunctional phosphoglucose/phosphomannose isomerase [Candidatus Bathyarchaeota archaeon]